MILDRSACPDAAKAGGMGGAPRIVWKLSFARPAGGSRRERADIHRRGGQNSPAGEDLMAKTKERTGKRADGKHPGGRAGERMDRDGAGSVGGLEHLVELYR